MMNERMNRYATFTRSLRDHSVVRGIARLVRIRIHYAQPIGPNIRFHIMKNSQWLAEYHAMKTSMP